MLRPQLRLRSDHAITENESELRLTLFLTNSTRGAMSKMLPISEAKMKLAELVAILEAGDEEVIITRNGRPAAILLATEAYEALQETLALRSNRAPQDNL
jgi:prevent-host-death family protein